MKPIKDGTLGVICGLYGIKRDALTFLSGGREDSDGILYTFSARGEKRLLKIVPKASPSETEARGMIARIEFAGYLSDHGVPVAGPIRDRDGELYKRLDADGMAIFAYQMKFICGHNPECSELSDKTVIKWGELTGRTHCLTKRYPPSLAAPSPNYLDEIAFFTDWCQDNTVRAEWRRMEGMIRGLSYDKDSGGFIHNDNHVKNILLNGDHLTLIDFDCACQQFFLQDIMISGQGMMLEETGGLFKPFRDMDRLRAFYGRFIEGYERHNTLDGAWYGRLGEFIQYRRLILFTCLQEWLAARSDVKNGLLDMIARAPAFSLK